MERVNTFPVESICGCLDEFILIWVHSFGNGLPDPLPVGAVREVRRLRRSVAMIWLLVGLALGPQLVCAVYGCKMFLSGIPTPCSALGDWLWWYCLCVAWIPFLCPFTEILVLWWGLRGVRIAAESPSTCQEMQGALSRLPHTVVRTSVVAIASFVLLLLLVKLISMRIQHIHNRWGDQGAATASVIERILAMERLLAPVGKECAICLQQDSELTDWRELPCHHAFHEVCLLEWLQRSHQCPLCRLNLHHALGDEEGPV